MIDGNFQHLVYIFQRSNSSFDLASDLADQSSQMSFSSTKSEHWLTARDLVAGGEELFYCNTPYTCTCVRCYYIKILYTVVVGG